MDFCGYFSNIADSRFYNLCRENGYQMDMALSEIVDALLVDEDYIHFSQERYTDVNDDKLDNFLHTLFPLLDFLQAFLDIFSLRLIYAIIGIYCVNSGGSIHHPILGVKCNHIGPTSEHDGQILFGNGVCLYYGDFRSNDLR